MTKALPPTRHIISINDLTNKEIETIFEVAQGFLKELADDHLSYRIARSTDIASRSILASLFYEPSTRTRLSFESAMLRLGGTNITSADPAVSSAAKGESLADTIRVISNYADIVVIRHPRDGAVRLAAEYAQIPVINGGGRQPLVPQRDRQIGQLRQVAGKGAGGLSARTFRTIHIDRESEHQSCGAPLSGKFEDTLGIAVKTGARNGLDRRRNPSIGIAGGNPDGLGAEIKTDQRAALRQHRGSIDERKNRHGKPLARTTGKRDTPYVWARISAPRVVKQSFSGKVRAIMVERVQHS